jgi:hypothetical protein
MDRDVYGPSSPNDVRRFSGRGKDLKAKIVERFHRYRAEDERREQGTMDDGWPARLKEIQATVRHLQAELDAVIDQKSMPISDAGDYDLTVLDQEKQTGVVVRLDPGIPADAFDNLDDALRSISGHHRSPTVITSAGK